MKILVTGGAGFIGSHLVEGLVENGHDVAVLDNFSTGSRKNISSIPAVKLFIADIKDEATFKYLSSFFIPDVIYHLAATGSIPTCNENTSLCFENNSAATLKLLKWAEHHKIKKVIFASSSSVYGESIYSVNEQHDISPISVYGLSKKVSEDICLFYNRTSDLKVVITRFFNVYGKKQRDDVSHPAFIPKLIKAAKANDEIVVYGDGEQSRSFTCVKDVVAGLILMLNDTSNENIYNIASSVSISLNSIIEEVKKYYPDIIVRYTNKYNEDEIIYSSADIGLIKNNLGFIPEYNIIEGISWMLEQ